MKLIQLGDHWVAHPRTDTELRRRALRELWANGTIMTYGFHDGQEVNRRVVRPRMIHEFAELFKKMRTDIQVKLFDLGDAARGLSEAMKGFTEAARKFPPKRWWQW